MRFWKFSGLDEAALGPKLGPFCACLTSFVITRRNNFENRELYNLLALIVTRKKGDYRHIMVADSKKTYSSATGIAILENGVLSFLGAAGFPLPSNFLDFIKFLCPPEDVQSLIQTPWFQQAHSFTLPMTCEMRQIVKNIRYSSRGMKESGVILLKPFLRCITARYFNLELDDTGNKGMALQNLIAPLIRAALKEHESLEGRITVDRQGGRRYYGAWLAQILPEAKLKTLVENKQQSIYRNEKHRLEFLVRADDLRLETALASMIAKYAREIAMRQFNLWWMKRIPGIKPCAGYPRDASRFIAELANAGLLPENRDSLIRRL